MDLPVMPPVKPMLAKPMPAIPEGQLYEPKWDGFRSIVFRDGDEVEIGSRNEKPMTRYFPEVVEAVLANFPERAVIDGEIVVIDRERNSLEFEVLQQRIHPAASRVRMLAAQTPASFVAFDNEFRQIGQSDRLAHRAGRAIAVVKIKCRLAEVPRRQDVIALRHRDRAPRHDAVLVAVDVQDGFRHDRQYRLGSAGGPGWPPRGEPIASGRVLCPARKQSGPKVVE